jgi:hypothetical protein
VTEDNEGTATPEIGDASSSEMPLREARDWVINANGRVQLVAGKRNNRLADLNPRCDRTSIDR